MNTFRSSKFKQRDSDGSPWGSIPASRMRIPFPTRGIIGKLFGFIIFVTLLCAWQNTYAAQIVYVAAQDTPGLRELYLVDITLAGGTLSVSTPVKLNPPLKDKPSLFTSGVNLISPVGTRQEQPFTNAVLYSAQQDTVGVSEIYIVKTDTPGVAVRLNAPLSDPYVTVSPAGVSPDGNKLVYILAKQGNREPRIMLVDMDRPGIAQELLPALPPTSNINGIFISPDSQRLAYFLTNNTSELFEANFIEFNRPGINIPIGSLPRGGGIPFDTQFSPDGTKLAFVIRTGNGVDREALYVVDVKNPSSAVQVNPPLKSEGVFSSFNFSPNSALITFRAQAAPNEPYNVFITNLLNPGTATQLNPPLAGSPSVGLFPQTFQEGAFFTPDGQHVIYNARQDLPDARELYQVSITGPGQTIKLSAPLDQLARNHEGVSALFAPTFDGRFVPYIEGFNGTPDAQPHLVVVDRQNPRVPIRPFGMPPNPGSNLGLTFSSDSQLIAFDAKDGHAFSLAPNNLYVAQIAVESSSVLVTPPRSIDSGLWLYAWMPDSGPAFGGTPQGTNPPQGSDLNGDGKADIVWRNTNSGMVAVWLMNGTAISSSGFPAGVPSDWGIAGVGDVNKDGNADIIWRNDNSGTVAVWLMDGLTITSVGFPGSTSTDWKIEQIGDVDGTGTEDLVWRNTNNGMVAVWLMDGAIIESSGFLGGVPIEWQIEGIGDVTGDGNADVIWRNSLNGTVAVWVMNGLTITSVGFSGSAPLDFEFAGAGDIDGNGTTDVVWHNTNSGVVVLWFMNGAIITSSGIVTSLTSDQKIKQIGDTNGDGKADLIILNRITGEASVVLLNGLAIIGSGSPGLVSTDWEIQ